MKICTFHRRQTFDHDVDVVVHWAQLILRRAAVISRIRLRHIHDSEGPLVVQEVCALCRELATLFGPGDIRGGPGYKGRQAEETKSNDDTRAGGHSRALRAEVMAANSFTYSPSAMHSISSTWPLSTILELEGPDGTRRVGFLSSAGSSTVTHTHTQIYKEKTYYFLFQWWKLFLVLLCGVMKPLLYSQYSGTKPLHYRPQFSYFMVGCKFDSHFILLLSFLWLFVQINCPREIN